MLINKSYYEYYVFNNWFPCLIRNYEKTQLQQIQNSSIPNDQNIKEEDLLVKLLIILLPVIYLNDKEVDSNSILDLKYFLEKALYTKLCAHKF